MNPAANILIHQEMRKAASDATSRINQASRARSIRELKQLSHVSLHPLVRHMGHAMPELRRLEAALERRAEGLCEEHLKALQAIVDDSQRPVAERMEAFKTARARYEHGEWNLMRGDFIRPLTQVRRRADELFARLHRQAKA